MKSLSPRLLALLWFLSVSLAPAPSGRLPPAAERAVDAITAAALRSHVEVLASDDMAGRGVGHAGNRRAEEYIAEALARAGVAPASGDSLLQPVELYHPAVGPNARLTITGDRGAPLVDLQIGSEFYPLPQSANVEAHGRLVFAGHGISAPRHRHDDYSRLDVRGAVALVLDSVPESLRGKPSEAGEADVASLARKIADAARHGATGLVVIRSYLPDVRTFWPEASTARLSDYKLYSEVRQARLPVAAIGEQAADGVRRALQAGQAVTARLIPDLVGQPIVVHNIVGMIEGRDRDRREMVVVGAHMDHDGIDLDGTVYNGADDNASGTAAVIEIAKAFARAAAQGERPARAIVFALWNGEEDGSLGAESFMAAPRPDRRVVANINLDMVGRNEEVDPTDSRFRGFPRTTPAQSANILHVLGYSYSPDLAGVIEAANEPVGLTLRRDYDSEAQGLLQRSDNWVFIKRGIPAVFLTTGLHPDYHTSADDTERIEFDKLARITRLTGRAAWLVADGPAPRFKRP